MNEEPSNVDNRATSIALIFNPVAGTDDAEARRSLIHGSVRDMEVICDIRETSEDMGAGPLAGEALENGARRIIVSGGDGSVVEAAEVLAGKKAALAVLPAGTANLLAHNAGIPTDHDAALQLALSGDPRPYDVGRANGGLFLIVVGIGADAKAVQDADRETKDRLGPLAYLLAAARNAARPRVRYRVTIDGRNLDRRARTVLVANAGQLPGQAAFVPDADPHDGWLDIAIVRARSLADVLLVGWGVLVGRRPDRNRMETHRGRHIVIETMVPQPVQRDGNEDEPATRLEVTIEPGALRLVHPPESESENDTAGPIPVGPALWKPLLALLAALGVGLLVARNRSRHDQPKP